MCFSWKGFSISHKHQTRLKGSSGEKHPILLQKLINYRCKKFQYIIVQVNTFLEDMIYAYCSNVYMTPLSCSFKPYLEGNLSYNNTIIDNQYPLCCVCGGYAGSQCIATWGQCYKTFYSHKLLLFIISESVCPWKAFPAQSYVCRSGQEPTLKWSILRCFILVGSGLTRKYQTGMERLARDKRSSLL